MSYKAKYGGLLDGIANEADAMAMSYFRGGAMGADEPGRAGELDTDPAVAAAG